MQNHGTDGYRKMNIFPFKQISFGSIIKWFPEGSESNGFSIVFGIRIRKAQTNKEVVIAVFFDVEKAYDMLWKEGLLIKLNTLGIGSRAYNWVFHFFNLIDKYKLK